MAGMGESRKFRGQLAWGTQQQTTQSVSDEEGGKCQHPGWFSNLHMHVMACACLYSYTGNTHRETK